MIHPITQSINLPPGFRIFSTVLLLPVISVTAEQINQKNVTVAPGDEKSVGFATENPGDTYQLDVSPGGGKKFKTTGSDNILGENSDGDLWQRVTNTEQLKRFKVTSANIHEGHEALFNLEFKKDGGGGGGGGGPLADAYVKAVNCFVKIHTPGTISAPGILIPAPMQVGKPYIGILQRNTDDEIAAGAEDCTSGSKIGTGLTADNDLLKVELSWNPTTLRPGMMNGKTLTLILPPGAKAYRDDGSQLTQFSVTIGSGGSGQLAQLASARKQNIFLEGNGTWNGGDVILKVDDLDITGAQGKAKLVPVDIKPDANMAGVVGDEVKSAKVPSIVKHFVTPKKTIEINQEYVELKAVGVDTDTFSQLLEWEGGEAGSTPDKRKVKRDLINDATKVKIKIKPGGAVTAQMNVWVVWCDGSPPQNIGASIPSTISASGPTSPQAGAIWTVPTSTQRYFEFTIKPTTIITESEIPKFDAETPVNPPPGPTITNQGATLKWDISRRIRIKHENPAPTTITRNQIWGSPNHEDGLNANASGFPTTSIEVVSFPSDARVGNDDRGSEDEDNNPYSDAEVILLGKLPAAKGKIVSRDKVSTPFILQAAGVNGENTIVKIHFGEFVRLEIGEGATAKWYRVSDFTDWKVEQRFNRNASSFTDSGSTIDNNNYNY